MIRLENVSKYYNDGNKTSIGISNINLRFNEKGLILIKGESGSGKTTLLKIISKKIYPDSGQVTYNEDITISIGYQGYNLFENYTAFENVYLECLKFNASNYANEKTLNLLNNLGLLQFKNQPIKYLSKGQQARVSFAKTIAQNADIYIFDEPTANLDSENANKMLEEIKRLSLDCLVIIAAHDEERYTEFASRIIELNKGLINNDLVIKSNDKLIHKTELKKNNIDNFILKTDLKRYKLNILRMITMLLLFISITFISLFCSDYFTKNIIYDDSNFIINKSLSNDKNRTMIFDYGRELSKSKLDNLGYDYEANPFYLSHKLNFYESNGKDFIFASYEPKPKINNITSGRLPSGNDEALLLIKKGYDNTFLQYLNDDFYYHDSKLFGKFKIVGIAEDENVKEVSFAYNHKIKNVIQNSTIDLKSNDQKMSIEYAQVTKIVSNIPQHELNLVSSLYSVYDNINVNIIYEHTNLNKTVLYMNPTEEIEFNQIFEAIVFKSPDYLIDKTEYSLVSTDYCSNNIISSKSSKKLFEFRLVFVSLGLGMLCLVLFINGEIDYFNFKKFKFYNFTDIRFKKIYRNKMLLISMISFAIYMILTSIFSILNPLKDNVILYFFTGIFSIFLYNIYSNWRVGR